MTDDFYSGNNKNKLYHLKKVVTETRFQKYNIIIKKPSNL